MNKIIFILYFISLYSFATKMQDKIDKTIDRVSAKNPALLKLIAEGKK